MTLLHGLSYAGAAAAFIFVTLSLASGLLWISELIEEHSRYAKVIGRRSIYAVIAIHVLLYFYDSLPLKHILFSIFCHIVYLQNFTASWPFISLTSLSFLASCVLVIVDHFLWFFYFAGVTQDARHRAHRTSRGAPISQNSPGFADIATFFGVCVWLAPLFLFLSLSANDNALPVNSGTSSMPVSPTSPSKLAFVRTRASLFKTLCDALPIDHLPRLRPRRRDTSEGIIAPRSPRPMSSPSPLHTPTKLPRVPSMNSLPPPLLPPSHRVSSDGHAPGASSRRSSMEQTVVITSDRLTAFSLTTPPRKMSVGRPPQGRPSTEGSHLELRRVVSAHSGGK